MKKIVLFGLVVGLLAAPTVRAADGEAAGTTTDTKKQGEELVATAKSCIDKAKMLLGDERKDAREIQYAAAADAYGKALELCPGWLVDDVVETSTASGGWQWARFAALQKRGNLWKAMNQYDKARAEYMKGFEKVAPAMVDLRSYIQMTIADSYFEEQNWIAAEEAYLKAQKIGLYGDRKHLVPSQLEKVKPLAEQQRKAQAGHDAK